LKNYWPHLSRATGFSIENLTRRYREKINNTYSSENLTQNYSNRNLKNTDEDADNISISNISTKRGHWANRDFSEYRNAA
tara:strand:- start:1340 stop:1579 length:240 start_codon:yes stop_codon:yes gene_type:complete